jgi:hypothetical protein
MDITERNVGRCLTERKRKDFDEAVKTFVWFVSVSQFEKQPKMLDEVNDKNRISTAPHLGIGYVLYGVHLGTLVWLGEIIDSSD